MQIPFCSIFEPNGSKPYTRSLLSTQETDSLIATSIGAIANKILDKPQSPYLGLIHRSVNLQVFGFASCTGWVVIVGLEHGPYDSDDVARSLLDRIYAAVTYVSCNPFFISLNDSKAFDDQLSNAIQSHSVMMTFMISSQILG